MARFILCEGTATRSLVDFLGGSMRHLLLLIGIITMAMGGLAHADAVDNVAAAREDFERGTRAYDLGHYAEAAKEYEAAYRAKDDPALLFNIGQAYRGANEPEKAIVAFRSYLRRVPEASNRDEVEARIAELQRLADAEHRSKGGAPQGTLPPSTMQIIVRSTHAERSPTPDELHSAKVKRITGFVVGGVGIASLALGGVLTGLAAQANGKIVQGDTWSPAQEDRRNGLESGYIASFAIGGAALATGLTLYLIGRHEQHQKHRYEKMEFTPAVGMHAAGAMLNGSF